MHEIETSRQFYPFSKHDEFVSVSRVKSLMMCPRKYMFKYKMGLVEEKKFYLTRGIIFHEMVNDLLLDSSKDIHSFNEKIADKFVEAKTNGLPISDSKTSESQVIDSVLNAFEKYYNHVNENNVNAMLLSYNDSIHKDKKTTEFGFRIPFVNITTMEELPDIDKDLFGFIDLIIRDPLYGISIWDHKLHSRKYNMFTVQTDIQLGLYAYVFKYLLKMGCFSNLDPNSQEFDTIRVGFNSFLLRSGGKVEFDNTETFTTYDDKKINAVVELVAGIIKNEKTMYFNPNFGEHCNYMCSFNEPCIRLSNGEDLTEYLNSLNSVKMNKLVQDMLEEEVF